MKNRTFFAAILAALLASAASAPAYADLNGSGSGMIELGAAAGFMGPSHPLEAVFRVDMMKTSGGTETSFVLGRVTADASLGIQGNSFLDMEFEALGLQFGSGDNYFRVSIVNADVQRDVQI